LQKKTEDSDINSENTDGLSELVDRLGEQQLKLDSQEKLISDLKDRITFIEKNRENDKENNNLIYLKKYIIQSGDNLSNICILNGLNFNSDINIIKAINGIKDINMIHTGQTILLPIDIKEK
jgi:LysM repeat protein